MRRQMSRLDPDFRIDQQGNLSSARRPYPEQLTPREGRPLPKAEDFARYEKALAEINAQVMATPTPITDELGRGTPKEPDFHEKVKKVAREYGVSDTIVRGYVEKTVFPGGRSGHQQWDGGYGSNARGALGAIEKQLNFFKQTGMTPLEATVKRYDGITSMRSRESEVASALGIPNYDQTRRSLEYIATLEDQYRDMLRMNSDHMGRLTAINAFENQLKQLRETYAQKVPDVLPKFDAVVAKIHAMPKGGRKSRKTRKSKKARKTRRRRA
jgi:hypothetical protein